MMLMDVIVASSTYYVLEFVSYEISASYCSSFVDEMILSLFLTCPPPSLNPLFLVIASPPWPIPMPHRRQLLAAAMSALSKLVDQASVASARAFTNSSFSQSLSSSKWGSGRNSSGDLFFSSVVGSNQCSTQCVGSMPPVFVALNRARHHAPFGTRSECSQNSATTTLSTVLGSTNGTSIFPPSPSLVARSGAPSYSTSCDVSPSPVTLNGVSGAHSSLPSPSDVLPQAQTSGREKLVTSTTQRRRRPPNPMPASDLLTVPGVGPRNLEKLMAKGIDQVSSLTQLYREKVRDVAHGQSSKSWLTSW